MKKIMMVIDDSAVVRQVMVSLLAADPQIVVGGPPPTRSSPRRGCRISGRASSYWMLKCREWTHHLLEKTMQERPTPVVICSTLTEAGAAITLEALAAGARTFITKPRVGLKQFLMTSARELTTGNRVATRANVSRLRWWPEPVLRSQRSADAMLSYARDWARVRTTQRVVAIGISTGGTQALETVLVRLPRVCPGLVVVQHTPTYFTAAFATRLDGMSEITDQEAMNNDRVVPGLALIALAVSTCA